MTEGQTKEHEPDQADDYMSRVIDVDSHEMIPLEQWADVFDQSVAERIIRADILALRASPNGVSRPDITGDEMPITNESVWLTKGPGAPSAIDLNRRVEVMDKMGIDRQIVFPTFASVALHFLYNDNVGTFMGFDTSSLDHFTLGRDMVKAHNKWAYRVTAQQGDRVRPCSIILPDTLEDMMEGAREAVDQGVRAVLLPAGVPPAGTSPADAALDPFWQMLQDADIPVVLHIGTEFALLASPLWASNVEDFTASAQQSIEFPMEPYRASIMHYSADQYLSILVLGGVFERFPRLRFGVMELMADWVGPLGDRLEIIFDQFKRLHTTLSLRPTQYLTRNVRVSPFFFEPIADYIRKYPFVSDILCYSSDFPHTEGGKYSKDIFSNKLDGFSDEVRRKFFVENGSWLLPA